MTFFRDILGMPVEEAHHGPEAAQVTILDAGRATLEIVNPAQQRYIDQLEVGRPVACTYHLALQVTDAHQTTGAAVAGGYGDGGSETGPGLVRGSGCADDNDEEPLRCYSLPSS